MEVTVVLCVCGIVGVLTGRFVGGFPVVGFGVGSRVGCIGCDGLENASIKNNAAGFWALMTGGVVTL